MTSGIKAHKEYLEALKTKMTELNMKFESGTLQDFEKDQMDILSQDIRERKQELKGFL